MFASWQYKKSQLRAYTPRNPPKRGISPAPIKQRIARAQAGGDVIRALDRLPCRRRREESQTFQLSVFYFQLFKYALTPGPKISSVPTRCACVTPACADEAAPSR